MTRWHVIAPYGPALVMVIGPLRVDGSVTFMGRRTRRAYFAYGNDSCCGVGGNDE